MKVWYAVWGWLQGKKAIIVAILGATITFSLTRGWIDKTWAEYLSSVLLILAGSANVGNYISGLRQK